MIQREILQVLARHLGDAAVVLSAGNASNDLFPLGPAGPVLYQMELGYAAAVALGVALGDPGHQVVAVEGDGSMIAALPVLSTIARAAPPNLLVLVTDNESYSAIQDADYPPFATATAGPADLAAVARGCGLERACTVRDADEADKAMAQALRDPGPWLIVAKLDPSPTVVLEPDDPRDRDDSHLPDVFDNALSFTREVRHRARSGARKGPDTHSLPGYHRASTAPTAPSLGLASSWSRVRAKSSPGRGKLRHSRAGLAVQPRPEPEARAGLPADDSRPCPAWCPCTLSPG
jgi:sulfopyruvate decarboxylase subunit beta